MKKILLTAVITLIGIHTAIAQVGIGTEIPAASAQLELQSTTKGFLTPRMTEDERNKIITPATGLMLWCTNCSSAGELQVYNGETWINIIGTTAAVPVTVPNKPSISGVRSGNGQVSVAFTAPGDDGGTAITSYTATSNPGDITGTLSQAGSGTITVSGLTNGTAYTFIVTATNAVGTSAASAASASATPVIVTSVTSSTGQTWMDRNLGASQVATSSTDAAAYGDLYQWGRAADGHQLRTSATTTTLSTTDTPVHGDFIISTNSPYDWRDPQNANLLWQGVDGVNNPCPSGYRVPTDAELDAERLTWSSNDPAGAYASPLKLPMAGNRTSSAGSLFDVGTRGYYWSSSVSSSSSHRLLFFSRNAYINTLYRAYGYSVRCLRD